MAKKNYRSEHFYSENYADASWRNQLQCESELLLQRIKEYPLFTKKITVLDVGCGSGDLGGMIKDRFQAEVHGIELNSEAIKNSKKQGLIVKKSDIEEKWPYQNGQFDVITATEIIEHVVNPDHFLQEAKRILKKNGHIVLTTPNLAAWFNRIIFLFGYQPFFMEVSTIDKTIGLKFTRKLTANREPVGHIRCFTIRALQDLLELHGYKVLLVKGTHGYYFPQPIKFIDTIISKIPSLSANMTIVAKKITT